MTSDNRNYKCIYWDSDSPLRANAPSGSTWWQEIARTTAGSPVLATLKSGTELYYVASYDTTWAEVMTKYGLTGYIKKSQITYDRHITPADLQPRTITEQLFRIKEVTVDRKAGTVSVSGSDTSQLTAQAAQTITPTTSDQTIAAGTYLTGAQTIKGDSDLVASNIKSGVTIFNVQGSLTSATVSQDPTTKVLTIS